MKNSFLIALLISITISGIAAESPRSRTLLDADWKFITGDPDKAQDQAFDDSSWRLLTLPHDWSIEGRFDAKNPMGGQGGFLPAGIGWYRKTFDAPAAWSGKRVIVEFEGVYMNADVWLNGEHLATHPYGYTSFHVDLTQHLKAGGKNVLAVRVDNSQQKNSRWYSGSGIYRHVWLTVTDPVHIAPWGIFVSVPKAEASTATVAIEAKVMNETAAAKGAVIECVLLAPDGKVMARLSAKVNLPASGAQDTKLGIELKSPPLWSPETPQISSATTRVTVNGQVVDEVTTRFGIRALAWSPEKGLTINGQTYKLNGGCIHHDNGVLGACAFDRAEERKIELLKAAGFNEIRTAHNPPSPALLDACDRLGMLVMDEAFDCWARGKNKFDYSVVFKDWWERDLDAMVLRDRNHPSVIFWSLGNEIPDLMGEMGAEYGPKLAARVHALDRTRPVTNGILGWPDTVKHPQSDVNADANWNSLDIVGTNYSLGRHIGDHVKVPKRVIVGTESSPGNPSNAWRQVTENTFVVGDNVWSAQDYLGEVGVGRWFYEGDPTEPLNPPKPTDPPGKVNPIGHGSDKLYPWHGANPGDLDLIGERKPMAHLRNIVWDKGEKLFLAVKQPEGDKKIIVVGWGWVPTWESWTWPGWENKPLEVEAYSRYEKVRLYLNDKLLEEKPTPDSQGFRATFKLNYTPGTLKAVGVQDGKEIGEAKLTTVGEAAGIRLTPDRTTVKADEQDLSFVKVEVVDKAGNLQPNATQNISFTITGPGVIAGLGNANLKSVEPYQGKECPAFHGRALVVIRSKKQPGVIELKAEAPGLYSARTQVTAK